MDCDDADPGVNPGELDDVGNGVDDNCNGRDALLTTFAEVGFTPFQWADVGSVTHLLDTVGVGSASSSASASTTRSLSMPLNTSVLVALDISSNSGAGLACELRLGTVAAVLPGPVAWAAVPVGAAGTQFLSFVGLIEPGRTLKKVQIACYGNRELKVDWLQIQDAELLFPPPRDLTFEWQDTRHPVGGATTVLARSAAGATTADDRLYIGSDVAGVGRYSIADGWQQANGTGADSLMAGGMMGVADILPIEAPSGELYALTGDVGDNASIGGLWYSPDYGDHWEQLGASLYEFPPDATSTTNETYDDDVAGYRLETNCPGSHFGRTWAQGGGRLLVANSLTPATGDVIYIANTDEEAMGVSVWDGVDVCPFSHTGDTLPQDRIGGMLRVDAQPHGTPVLIVGYRGRVNDGDSVYVCELPFGGMDCDPASVPADCQVVSELAGADVRDLEWDTWLADGLDVVGFAGVLVADGGDRPSEPVFGLANDGIGNDTCDADLSNISELFISDGGSALTTWVEPDLAVAADMQDVDITVAGHVVYEITGISLDPLAEWVYANTPLTPSAAYRHDRMYRAAADDLLLSWGVPSPPVWEAINSGQAVAVATSEEDYYEGVRHDRDLDLSGSWMESEFNGRAAPFPARAAPGASYDTVWWGFSDYALIAAGTGLWRTYGLDAVWLDNEGPTFLGFEPDGIGQPEGDVEMTFWPTIDVVEHQTYQSTVVLEAAISRDGHIWSANMDQALAHLDATTDSVWWDPRGAEIDCLWHGWSAGAGSVSIVEAVEPVLNEETQTEGDTYPVVWATLIDQGDTDNPQRMGVIRTMDNGTTWQYAAAGWIGDNGQPALSISESARLALAGDAAYGDRACLDEDDAHVAEPFDITDVSAVLPTHAFSQAIDPDDAILISSQSIGQPAEVRALNERAALVLFRPGTDGTGRTGGGFYLTADGGGTWTPLDFDGGTAGCDFDETFDGATFEIIHPGAAGYSSWTGDALDATLLDTLELDILVQVRNADQSVAVTDCSIARVNVQATATSSPTATWAWYTLPYTSSGAFDAAGTTNACGVDSRSLVGASPAPWSDVAMIHGAYTRSFGGASNLAREIRGGACLMDLDSGALTMVIDPRAYAAGISAVEPHPEVADVWAILPELSPSTWQYCTNLGNGADPVWGNTDAGLACPYPYPIILQGNANGWQTTTMNTGYPNTKPLSASWSPLGVADDSSDGTGSWLVVGTGGSGTWRGEMTW